MLAAPVSVLLDPLNQFLSFDPFFRAYRSILFYCGGQERTKILDYIDLTSNLYRYSLHDRTVHSKLLAMFMAAVPYVMKRLCGTQTST